MVMTRAAVRTAVGIAASLVFALTACSTGQRVDLGGGDSAGRLVAAIAGEPDQLDPNKTSAYFSFEVLENVYDTLVEPDANLHPSGRARRAPANADTAPVNVPLTDDVRAQLVQAGATLTGRPASEFGGLREGETYLALLPENGVEWASAKLHPNPGQYEAGVVLQDQNSLMFFHKSGTPGSTWIPMGVGFGPITSGDAPCPIPESVRDLWQWPQGKCYPPPR